MASGAEPRVVANASDAARATEILTEAFHLDPVWGWAFPDPDRRTAQHTIFWRFFVDAAIPNGWVWLTADGGAATLWIPPGCPEIPPQDEQKLEPMLIDLVGADQTAVLVETFERFDAAHPRAEPHYYLSLLGTHPDHRGQGIGMGLVADNLAVVDADRMPAYLESTNPANNKRYERLGFEQVGEFSLPGGGPSVATMWRSASAG
jgi:GNAT superfamily N-acetyltransferase